MQPFRSLACSSRWEMREHFESGTSRAIREAYESHAGALLRLCVLLTGRRDQAEDIVQDAFLRSADALDRLTEEEVGPYLRATAINVWRNKLRRLAIERKLRPRGDRRVELAYEERDVLWNAVLRLPDRQRACLVLRFYEDLTERDTARVLGCSLGTVKSQTSRAIAKLRREVPNDD